MTTTAVDLAQGTFWWVLGAAVLLLTPLVEGRLRQGVLAAANLAFPGLLLGPLLLPVAAGVLLFWWALRLVAAGWRRRAVILALGTATLLLFLVHKLPGLPARPAWEGVGPVVGIVGFSYVALRLVDVLREVASGRHPSPGLLATVNYLLPFHMLLAGPIQSYEEFAAQPEVPPPPTARGVLEGCERIVLGLFKKFVLAVLVERLFLTGYRGGAAYGLLEAQAFFIWLYLDFSALSDIAVGAGRLLGVATPENFRRPYLARNMTDFWERWHISLSSWIRRNLFIPLQLGLVRRAKGRRPLLWASLALIVAFVFCGLWHEVSVPFLLWGGMHALGVTVANLYRHLLRRRLGARGVAAYLADRRIRAVATFVTFEFVAASLVIIALPWRTAA